MNESKIAVRYARALYGASLELDKLDNIQSDLNTLLKLVEQVTEFSDLLESPILNVSKKQELFKLLFKGKVEDLTYKFLFLLSENKREVFLPSVCRVFEGLYKKKMGIMAARVITAGGLDKISTDRVKKTLKDYFKSNIELQTDISSGLIGGFVLRVEDQQLDSSVSTQLKKIRKQLDQSVIT